MLFKAMFLAVVAAVVAADDRSACKAKADRELSGVWRAINAFCNGFGPSIDIFRADNYATSGVTIQGAKDSTHAFITNKKCGKMDPIGKDNCFGIFYATCAQGDKKGRAQKRFGPTGCVYVNLKDA